MKKILLVGASGLFGRGLARGLSAEPGFDLILAGRRLAPLEKLRQALLVDARSKIQTAVLDIADGSLRDTLVRWQPDLLIHCAGPFQGADRRVAEACLAQGVHYLDLADARDFVGGISALDAEARAAGRFVLSGASTVPALSGAVVRRLAAGCTAVHGIDIAIAPGNRTERGLATVAAILGYCGKPIPAWTDGRRQHVFGWLDLHRPLFAGPIGRRWQSAVDLPDVDLLPNRYPELKTLRLSAGLELSLLHLGLWSLSWLARWHLLPLSRLAPLLKWCSDWLVPFGTDTGGMCVQLTGSDVEGKVIQRRFDLIAEQGIGPRVPTLAALILAKRLRDGVPIEVGARVADADLDYAEFEREWQALGMRAVLSG
ncbi:MAG: saccharopine dehydrogenase NADP-binding domain-containing protein [Ahniella sp.]|nr:saccharopine dehydrogenase NADP-binding domain-containing protein [Ahniella sp.]